MIDSIEERVIRLEQKVRELEGMLQKTAEDKKNKTDIPAPNVNCYNNAQVRRDQPPYTINQISPHDQVQHARPTQPIQKPDSKLKEAVVGKYLIGALASLLIFIAAISLVGLVWNDLTSLMKLALITSVGIILTGLGFWLIRSKKNPITSIILGTGSGLLFISILSADLSFHLIDNNVAILLASIWSVFFILSSSYINAFFTTIIAYIGSYIALILGLSLLNGDLDLLVMTLFVSIVSAVMIYNALINKKRMELNISIALIFLSFITILLRAVFDGGYSGTPILKYYVIQTIIMLIIYALNNVQFRLTDTLNVISISWHFVIASFTTILTGLFIYQLSNHYLHFETLTCYILFFMINVLQLISTNVFLKNVHKILTIYYASVLILTSILINVELTDAPTGIIIVAILLLLIEIIFKKSSYHILISFIVLLDSLFFIMSGTTQLIYPVYGVVQLLVITYILYKKYTIKQFKYMDLIKVLGAFIALFNGFAIIRSVIEFLSNRNGEVNSSVAVAIGYILAILSFTVLFKLDYFKNWSKETFRFFGDNKELKMTGSLKVFFYILSTGLYFIGLLGIGISSIRYDQFIYTIATLIITLVQSYSIITTKNKKGHMSEIWIGVKYLILTFVTLSSYINLTIDSVIYSVAGLVISIACISIGFKLRYKGLRLYGLILTIVMVVKFILIDLSQENSITRVIALVFGGLICFGISVLYNKLNTLTE